VRADAGEARRHYDRALKAYNLQEFPTALEEFRGAYVEQPDPSLLFNIGQCQRQLRQYEAASRSYRAYARQLAEGPQRDEAVRLAAQMDDAAASARALDNAPPSGPAAAPAAVIAAPAPPRRPPPSRRPVGISLLAIGGAALVAGAGVVGAGAALDGDARHAATLEGANQAEASAATYQTAGWVTFGIGAAVCAVGGIVFGLGR
jgi:tetratricopeptide (TPR) repeat protein